MRRICVIGTGYVGLVTGACLADLGNLVVCTDNDAPKIALLTRRILPIYEPGLEDLVKKNVQERRLAFTTSIQKGIREAEVIFIAVGTPPQPDGSADLQYVEVVT
ncbi:MAG: UDP-glucose/GDP-mannose dehydrogenase family protein, partial [Elusimicrobia bacterium]|nr:UDP-glucose/GDP-mannose dehydrogenase family protein [Elusimicrobiota bacterium]